MPRKFPDFHNFGEYLYYAYANLQMLHYALKDGKPKYDRMCYMIRAKAFRVTRCQARCYVMILSPNYHRIVHKANPHFNRKTLSFEFSNGLIEKVKLNRHL